MASAPNRRSISVEKIESLSGINTGAGDLAFIRDDDDDGRSSRFSLMWRSEDGVMLTHVFDLRAYEMKYLEDYNLVELAPCREEEKLIIITFRDSESLKQFQANIIEDAMRMKSKSFSHTDRKFREGRPRTVHEDNLSTRLKPIREKAMEGVMLPDIHVRPGDLSSPATTTVEQPDGSGEELGGENTDSTSHSPLQSDEDRSSTGSDELEWGVYEDEAHLSLRRRLPKKRRNGRSEETMVDETSQGSQGIQLDVDQGESLV